MSKASEFAQALATRLAGITIANGYETDIGTTVFRGKARIDSVSVPCAVIYEAGDKIENDSQSASLPRPGEGLAAARLQDVQLMQRYFIEGHAPCDPNHPNDVAHQIISDIKRALFSGDRTMGGLTRRLLYKGRAIGRREDGELIINASIVIDAEIVENLANP